MQITKKLMVFTLLLFLGYTSYAQVEAPVNPTASSIVSAVGYPVDYSTGIPSITVPLYSLPTRSKEVSVDMQLSFHPASVSSFNEKSGSCGRGWSLSGGGVIQITGQGFNGVRYPWKDSLYDPSEEMHTTWNFSFNGMSGKIVLSKNNYGLGADIYESNGRQITIVPLYNADQHFIDLTGFIIKDEKGFEYRFMERTVEEPPFGTLHEENIDSYMTKIDTSWQRRRNYCYNCTPKYYRYRAKTAFHLSEIRDMHDKLLVGYLYKEFKTQADQFNIYGQYNYAYTLRGITSEGFGRVNLETESVSIENFTYSGVSVFDYHYNKLRDFTFVYVGGSSGLEKLIELFEEDGNGGNGRSHKFEYRSIMHNPSMYNIKKDTWGYPNLVYKNCSNQKVTDEFSTNGVLQKIILPTGGCVVYDFESNTYSYDNSRALDYIRIPGGGMHEYYTDPEFFYWVGLTSSPAYVGRNNYHNFKMDPVDLSNANTSFYFNSGNKFINFNNPGGEFYVKIDGLAYEGPDLTGSGEPSILHPVFRLLKNGLPVKIFEYEDDGSFGSFDTYYFCDSAEDGYLCLGYKIVNGAGSYKFEMTTSHLSAQGSAFIYKHVRKPVAELKKWWYGGGIRIRSISYFPEDINASQYLINPSTYSPARKINFDYNFFNEPNRSSGALVYGFGSYSVVSMDWPPVFYSNVSVTDTATGGKTQYVFNSPFNIPECEGNATGGIECFNVLIGKPKQTKVLNNTGKLLRQIDYEYFSYTHEPTPTAMLDSIDDPYHFHTGWYDLKKQVTKDYNTEGSSTDVLETTDEYTYYDNRTTKSHTRSSAFSGEVLETKYTYVTGYVGSQNPAYLPKTTKEYRNGVLTGKSNIEYHERPVPGPGSLKTRYQPYLIQAAKGDTLVTTRMRINKYDDFNHVLETEVEGGVKTAYIWGYNNSMIIAKIENMAYDAIPANLITAAQDASNVIGSGYNENNVATALDNLRNATQLSQAFVVTYTHKPLVGITTVTDARGRKQSYEYDSFGRLARVKDQEGNILSENQYNIIAQD